MDARTWRWRLYVFAKRAMRRADDFQMPWSASVSLAVLRDFGFPVLVSCALGFVLWVGARHLVDSHIAFLGSVRVTNASLVQINREMNATVKTQLDLMNRILENQRVIISNEQQIAENQRNSLANQAMIIQMLGGGRRLPAPARSQPPEIEEP